MRVCVIGGGLMGAATAFFLARRGVSVRLLERGIVGAGATTASFGNVRRQGRALCQLPLAHRSRALWGDIAALLGEDVEFRSTGHLRLAFEAEAVADMEAFATAAAPHGLTIEMLSANELFSRFPWAGREAIAGSISPHDGSANPRLVPAAFARAAAREGVTVEEGIAVSAVRRAGAGLAVETDRGTIEADAVLNAAGAWGAALAASAGEPVPLTPQGPQMGVTEPLPPVVAPVVGIWSRDPAANVYFRQVERGNIVFGGGGRVPVEAEPGHAKVDPRRTLSQLTHVARLFPGLARAHVIRTWSGCEGYLPDMLPVLGPSSRLPGLFHAFGFCGHGFQLGPGVGEVMAELIATGASDTPIAAMDISRFAAADRSAAAS